MATYYVATNGNDNNQGSIGSPFLTINRAVQALAAGDTLYVRAGTYAENLNDPAMVSGSSWSNKVTVSAYPGETVWMKPADGVDYVASFANGTGTQYLEFDGINLDSTNASGTPMGGLAVWAPGYGGVAHHIRWKNAEILGNRLAGDHATSRIAVDWLGFANDTGSNEAINLKVHGSGGNNSYYGFYIHTPNNLVDSCEIYDIGQTGIQVYEGSGSPNGTTVRKTRIHDITQAFDERRTAILVTGNNGLYYDNLIWNINAGATFTANQDAIYVFGGDSNQIFNNTVTANVAYGIHVEAGVTNTQVINNIGWSNSTDWLDSGTGTTNTTNLFGTNPLFVAPSDTPPNLQLLTGSPAIDAGTTEASVPDDFLGVTRPQGAAYDIGAYEYQSTMTSWARVANSQANANFAPGTSPNQLTLGAAVAIGNRIIVEIATTATTSITSVVDDQGNTYIQDASYILGYGLFFYSAVAKTAATPTITLNWVGTGGSAMAAAAYTGLSQALNAVDVAITANSAGVPSTTPASGSSARTSAPHELVIGGFMDGGSSVTYTPGGGATLVTSSANGNADIALTEQDSGATLATQSASGTLSGSSNWSIGAVVYELYASSVLNTMTLRAKQSVQAVQSFAGHAVRYARTVRTTQTAVARSSRAYIPASATPHTLTLIATQSV